MKDIFDFFNSFPIFSFIIFVVGLFTISYFISVFFFQVFSNFFNSSSSSSSSSFSSSFSDEKVSLDSVNFYSEIISSLEGIKSALNSIKFMFFLYLLGLFISFLIHTVLPLAGAFAFLKGLNSLSIPSKSHTIQLFHK